MEEPEPVNRLGGNGETQTRAAAAADARSDATSVAREAWVLLAQVFHGTEARNAAISADYGLTNQQGLALTLLQPGTPLRMRDLADALHCANSQLTAVVDRLEELGLATRTTGRDRREKFIALTDHGVDVRAKALDRYHEPPAALRALTPEEQQILRDVLATALERAQAADN